MISCRRAVQLIFRLLIGGAYVNGYRLSPAAARAVAASGCFRHEVNTLLSPSQLLAGGGLMGSQMRRMDWAASPLGAFAHWPPTLLVTLGVALNSGFPMYLAWGQSLTSFYNDAYRPFLGTKIEALGRPMPDVWPEVWDDIGPIVERAQDGAASYFEDKLLMLERYGYKEQTWWTFSFSPVRNIDSDVGGVLCIVYETTAHILTGRRLRFRIDLSNRIRQEDDPKRVVAAAAERLGRHLRQQGRLRRGR
jgi:hypothetical protein